MEPNVIIKYKRPSDCWVCPGCDCENSMDKLRCSTCTQPMPGTPEVIKAWNVNSEMPIETTKNAEPRSGPTHTAATAYSAPAPTSPAGHPYGGEFSPEKPPKKKSHAVLITILTLLIIGIIVAVALFIINKSELFTPGETSDKVKITYNKAIDEFNSKNYQEAISLFESLPEGYENSEEMIKESKYQRALQLKNEKKYNEAKDIFNGILDYKDSSEQVKDCMYKYAIELYSSEKYEEAKAIFTELDGYLSSKNYIENCVFSLADKQVLSNDYVGALALIYEYTSGNLNHSKFESIQTKLRQYNNSRESNHGASAFLGEWKTSDGKFLSYQQNESGGISWGSSMPYKRASSYNMVDGLHCRGTSYDPSNVLWAIQRINSSSIKVFNYYDGTVYEFKKQQ